MPEAIRKDVEQYVAARLPPGVLEKLHDPHARREPISSDRAFFQFGGGMAVRNLGRQRLSDEALAACGGFPADWDSVYVGLLSAIAAMRQ